MPPMSLQVHLPVEGDRTKVKAKSPWLLWLSQEQLFLTLTEPVSSCARAPSGVRE